MSRNPDAIVIGAGVVGAAVAYALAREGLRVTVLDRSFRGSGVSAAAMGHIVVMDDSEAQFALTSWSRRLLDTMVEDLPASCEYERRGTLWIARDDSEMDAARKKQGYYTERGVAAEVLDSKQLAEAEPHLTPCVGALFVPDDGILYPPAFAAWLLDRARLNGATLHEGMPVRAIEGSTVTCDTERLESPVIILATGPSSPSVIPDIPVIPKRGHLAITDRYPGVVNHQLVELGYLKSAHTMNRESVAFNVQPRATGQILIGSSREIGGMGTAMGTAMTTTPPSPGINGDLLRRMLRRAVEFVPTLADLSIIRVWTGVRPATVDNLPLIGQWDDHVWLATGHEGLGVTTALATGEILATLITGREPAIDARPYAPHRNGALVEA